MSRIRRSAVIYCRISKDAEGKLGVARQQAECEALCEAAGLNVLEVVTDNDMSAYSGKPRPGWNHVADLIRSREVDVLVGWAPDRFTRHPRELETLVELLSDTGVKVRTVRSGDFDLSTEDGRMVARITGAVARQSSERQAARLQAKHRELATGRIIQWRAQALRL